MSLQDPAREGSPGGSSQNLAAMGQLCELVRRFNHRSYQDVIEFPWGELPRCRELGLEGLDPTAHELTRQRCRLFLEAAIAELEPLHPAPVGDVSPIEILRRHAFEGDTWDVILAERKEQGLPRLSERTLKNRQRDGYRLVLRWAEGRPTGEEQQLDLPFSHPRERVMRGARWVGGGVLAVLVLWGLVQLRPSTENGHEHTLEQDLRRVEHRYIGRALNVVGVGTFETPSLAAVLPELRLPDLPREVNLSMLLPAGDDGIPLLLLTTDSGGNGGGTAWLWHPIEDRFCWKLHWEPPYDEIRTHESLVEPVHEEDWGIRGIGYRQGEASLEDRVALVYQQRYSPTFVLFVGIQSGEPLWHYTHPGHVRAPFVVDVNQDGRAELLLTGTDNVTNRPVLVALDPHQTHDGAASTVMWNRAGEGALYRVLFPAVPELERPRGHPRQALGAIQTLDWMPATRLLVVRAGLNDTQFSTYMCYLRDGWQLLQENGLLLEDNSRSALWEPAGLDFDAMQEELIAGIELIPGPGFADFVESTSPGQ